MSPSKVSGKKRERDDDASSKPTVGKGLRHFSLKVCKKVEEKGQTTYNEVADELVTEFMALNDQSDDEESSSKPKGRGKKGTRYDEKNIRRRVYDALNVLMAMDIISKEKKQIKWIGLPTSGRSDLEMLHRERERRIKEIQRKRENLRELLVQQICYRNLVRRNREKEAKIKGSIPEDGQSEIASSGKIERNQNGRGSTNPINNKDRDDNEEKIPVPFIVVNTSSQSVIQCEMGPDRTEVFFNFSKAFEINDDNEILKRLGMHKTTIEELRCMLPRNLFAYCMEHRILDTLLVDNGTSHSNVGGPSHCVDYNMAPGPRFGPHHLAAHGGYRHPGMHGPRAPNAPGPNPMMGGHPYAYNPQLALKQQAAHNMVAPRPSTQER